MFCHRTRRRIRRLAVATAAASAFTVLAGPFLIPVPPLKDIYPPRTLADPDSQFIEINGLSIHVKTSGQGEPVFVLLHGFAASLYSWHAVMDPFSQLGKVIAFDRTGFGLSAHPLTWQQRNPYSSESQVAQLIGLLDYFGVNQAILVGSSAGGTVAMQTALARPDRVLALVLVDPAVYVGRSAPWWAKPLLTTPQMRHVGPLIVRQLVRRGPELLNLAWHNPSLIPPDILELYKKPFQVENWDQALWEVTLASRPSGIVEHLGEINLPVLVVTGDDDRIVPTKDSLRLADELPNAKLVVIPDSGHLPHEECPGEFMDAVTNFLSVTWLKCT